MRDPPPAFDGHNDLALRILEGEDPSGPLEGGHLDLPRMREGGFAGGVFAVWVEPGGPDPLGRTLEAVERVRRYLEETPGFRVVLSGRDLPDGPAGPGGGEREEVAAVLGVEGGYGIAEGKLHAVDRLFEAGVRCLTLTWMEPTAWADAAGVPPVHGGLSRFGGRVVEKLASMGMAVDVSHASDAAAAAALERAPGAVLVSHSATRSLSMHPRNLPDPLLESLARAEGVVGVNFFPAYLDVEYGHAFERVRARPGDRVFTGEGCEAMGRETEGLPPVGLGELAAHLEHALSVAGSGVVGLGSDFDGVPLLPRGLRDVRDLPRLAAVLAERGLDDTTLGRVFSGNLLRFFRAVLP